MTTLSLLGLINIYIIFSLSLFFSLSFFSLSFFLSLFFSLSLFSLSLSFFSLSFFSLSFFSLIFFSLSFFSLCLFFSIFFLSLFYVSDLITQSLTLKRSLILLFPYFDLMQLVTSFYAWFSTFINQEKFPSLLYGLKSDINPYISNATVQTKVNSSLHFPFVMYLQIFFAESF